MAEEKVWELLAELVASQQKTDEQIAKTDAQLAKTDAKLDRIAEMLGGVSNNQGKIAEEFFYNSLKHNPVLVGKQFDSIFRNVVGSTRESQKNTTSCFSTVTPSLSSRSSIEYTPKTLKHSSNAKAATSHCCFRSIEIFNVT